MQTTAKNMKKTIYVSEDLQEKIERLKGLLEAQGIDLRDHTGVIRDGVLFRVLVEDKLTQVEKGGNDDLRS